MTAPARQIRPTVSWLMAALLVATGVPVLVAAGMGPASATAGAGSTPSNPIQVTSASAVPAGSTQTGSTTTNCATTTTWTHTVPAVASTSHSEYRYSRVVPAVAEVNHTEYRWPLLRRTYTPAQAEQSHQVYSYKKTVQDYRTEHRYMYRKHVRGNIHNASHVQIGTFAYELYSPVNGWGGTSQHEGVWGQTGLTDGSGAHGGTSSTFTYSGQTAHKHSTMYEYKRAEVIESRQVASGTHDEFSGEITTTLGSPWVLLDGYPKTVIDMAAVPASFSPWVADGVSPWSTNAAAPADPDAQTGDTNPANLRMVGSPQQQRTVVDSEAVPAYTEYYVAGGTPSRTMADASWVLESTLVGWTNFEERSVSDNNAKPAVVTYYSYNDQKVCAITPSPVPVVEVEGQEAGRATGRLYTSCQRTVRVTMKNSSSSPAVYKVKVGKKVTKKTVAAESTKTFTTTGANKATATLMLGNKVLAKKRIPGACARPEVLPETGQRLS